MFLSIVIPVYNVEQYIAGCLSSCIGQDISADDCEIVLVDDGSPDRSMEIARNVLGNRPNVKLLSQKNAGLGAARNAGLSAAEGDFIWFVDSDDRIAENSLSYLSAICQRHTPDIVAFCAANMIDGEKRQRFSLEEEKVRKGKDYIIKGDLQVCAPFSVFNRKFLAMNNLKFEEGIFHEDSEFTPRAYYYAGEVISSSRILYYVTVNPHSITRSVNPKKAFDSIETVQRNISNFALSADKECLKGFNDLISSDFNHALKNSYSMNEEQRAALDKAAYDNRYLLRHLKHASRLKYRISGLVYSLFPKHISRCYRFMQIFNFSSRN